MYAISIIPYAYMGNDAIVQSSSIVVTSDKRAFQHGFSAAETAVLVRQVFAPEQDSERGIRNGHGCGHKQGEMDGFRGSS